MRREPARMGYMVVFTNPGFIMQTLCFKSHLAFFAGMVGEGIYIVTIYYIARAKPESNAQINLAKSGWGLTKMATVAARIAA